MSQTSLIGKLQTGLGNFDNQWNTMKDTTSRFDSSKGDMFKAIDQLKKVKEDSHKRQEEIRLKLESQEKEKVDLEKELRSIEFDLKKKQNEKEKTEKEKDYTS